MSRFLSCAALLFTALASFAPAQTVRVAAAADLEPVLPPIFAQFERTTGIHAEATYRASATLTTQIENGAPFDLFFSADMDYPRRLIADGLAEGEGQGKSGTPILYARGTLVLWTRNDSHLPPPSLDLLRNPALKTLAIANPQRAPYGKAAVAALEKLGFYSALEPRLVTAENIAQAAQFVDSGNAQAGLISMTAAMTPRLASAGSYFVIPRNLYPPIEQGAAIITKSSQQAGARKLLDFILSPPIQQELRQRGLTPAITPSPAP